MVCPKPLALFILDGFGLREKKEGNAIAHAHTPNLDKLFANYPYTNIKASGAAVGLPEGQMGNSEVGHLNLGAGRIVYQDYTRLNKAIAEGSIKENKVLNQAIDFIKKNNSSMHLIGLLSDGGVHSHNQHLYALLKMLKEKNIDKVYIHAVLDGRDTPPRSAKKYILELEEKLAEIKVGEIATVSGRYYVMDRDNRWDRVEKGYQALVYGQGEEAENAINAVENAYQGKTNDEFVLPTVIKKSAKPIGKIKDNDSIIFYNFRADRARQITQALALKDFKEFPRHNRDPSSLYYVCITEYNEEFNLPVAFPPLQLKNGLGELISKKGLKQLRIAETEKYAHVTFFFNGGEDVKYPGEDRILIDSPKVATYDLKPEMSAYEVTEALLEKVASEQYDLIILNFANPDMVGHTGFFEAAVKAIEVVDECIGKLLPAILAKKGQILLTADHGNSEKMIDRDGEPFTAHTTGDVPLIYIGGPENVNLKSGKLADIAPTILDILEIDLPTEMTGVSLIEK